jgi:hypothetical protein
MPRSKSRDPERLWVWLLVVLTIVIAIYVVLRVGIDLLLFGG